MGKTKIEWADYTFNPWVGCTKVSAGCKNCYAEAQMDKMYSFASWGKGQPRRKTSPQNWKKPLMWNKQAMAEGWRPRVFCASLADVFDREVPDMWRLELFDLINATKGLDWLLLTKRPDYAFAFFRERLGGVWPENAWIGTSVEDESQTIRVPWIERIPAPVRFLSCEPLLGPVPLGGMDIDWVIVGGESGANHRPIEADWVRDIRDQCASAGIPFFFKQWGGRTAKTGGRLLDGAEYEGMPSIRSVVAKDAA